MDIRHVNGRSDQTEALHMDQPLVAAMNVCAASRNCWLNVYAAPVIWSVDSAVRSLQFFSRVPTFGNAIKVAQACIDVVLAQQIVHAESPIGPWLSLSDGVASVEVNAARPALSLIERADAALYRAKHLGRARYATLTDAAAYAPYTARVPPTSDAAASGPTVSL